MLRPCKYIGSYRDFKHILYVTLWSKGSNVLPIIYVKFIQDFI